MVPWRMVVRIVSHSVGPDLDEVVLRAVHSLEVYRCYRTLDEDAAISIREGKVAPFFAISSRCSRRRGIRVDVRREYFFFRMCRSFAIGDASYVCHACS